MIYVIAPYDYFKIITIDPYYYSDAVSNLRHYSLLILLSIPFDYISVVEIFLEIYILVECYFFLRLKINILNKHLGSSGHLPMETAIMGFVTCECSQCQDRMRPFKVFCRDIYHIDNIKWQRWARGTGGKVEPAIKEGSVRDLLEDLKTDLEEPTKSTSFFQHLFTAFWQYSQFKIGKSNPEEESAYQFIRDSIIFLSDDIQHDHQAVKEFTLRALELLKQKIVISKVTIWSDGAASQYKCSSIEASFHKHEEEKKRAYNARIIEVEKATFTPLVFSTTGGVGEEAKFFLKRAATLLAHKKGNFYSDSAAYIRRKLSFCILRTVLVALRGYRGRPKINYQLLPSAPNEFREFDSHCRERFSLQPIISGDVSAIVLADIVPADVIPSQDMKDDPQSITRLPPISPVKRTRQVAKCHSSKAKSELDSSFLANEIRKANTTISVLDRKHDRLKRYYKEKEKTKSSTQPLDPADQSILDLEAKLATKDAVIFELQNEKLILEEHIKEVEADVKVT
ncbi:hypothetical protein GQR58_021113 [Nymphon striatum]|nr:hypothetical protein GQR58_021113 [Nymphon striatum]